MAHEEYWVIIDDKGDRLHHSEVPIMRPLKEGERLLYQYEMDHEEVKGPRYLKLTRSNITGSISPVSEVRSLIEVIGYNHILMREVIDRLKAELGEITLDFHKRPLPRSRTFLGRLKLLLWDFPMGKVDLW